MTTVTFDTAFASDTHHRGGSKSPAVQEKVVVAVRLEDPGLVRWFGVSVLVFRARTWWSVSSEWSGLSVLVFMARTRWLIVIGLARTSWSSRPGRGEGWYLEGGDVGGGGSEGTSEAVAGLSWA